MSDQTESGIYKDITYDVHGKMIISAEAFAVSEKGSNEVMLEISKGFPRTKEEPPQYVRNFEVKHDIREGDRVYFHYLTLEDPHNYVTFENGMHIYKVPVNDVFLSMRPDPNGKYAHKGRLQSPVMHNQYVLGEPYWGTGWEEIDVDGKKVGAKTNGFGLVTETKDEPVKNRAIITDIGKGIKPFSRFKEVKPGDVVLLNPDCEFVNEIDNQERWVFTHEDILGTLDHNEAITPCGDGVLIELKEREYKGKLKIDTSKLPLESEGTILSTGALVDDELFEVGDQVKFHPKRTTVIEDKYAIVPESYILGILKHSM